MIGSNSDRLQIRLRGCFRAVSINEGNFGLRSGASALDFTGMCGLVPVLLMCAGSRAWAGADWSPP